MLNPRAPVSSESVETQAIDIGVNLVHKPGTQRGPLGRIDLAFEDRVLDPLPEISTDPCHPSEPTPPCCIAGCYIVSD